ncbi:MAG: ABC transporter substrate-binding protein [Armatimonadota bacterium]|nr:ABC transporter substrate-binding protein [Armatimonadota bacterium]
MRVAYTVRAFGILLALALVTPPLAAQPQPIYVGMAAPMTGDNAEYGQRVKEGIDLAFEEINRAGGVLGRPLRLVVGDDKGDPKEAVAVAEKMVLDKRLVAMLGHFFSSATIATAPIYNRAGMVQFAIASTNPKVAKAGPWTFRINVGDDFQARQLAEWTVTRFKKSRVGILWDNTEYGKGFAQVFRDTVAEFGGKIVASETFVSGQDKDFSVFLTKIRNANPEVLALASYYSDAALIALQARKLGYTMPIIGGDGIYSPEAVKIAGQAFEGVIFPSHFVPTSTDPKVQAFLKAYRARYNKDPDQFAPYAYDAAYVLALAIKRSGKADRAAIRDALQAIRDYRGVTGLTDLSQRVVTGKRLPIVTIQGGQVVLYPVQ